MKGLKSLKVKNLEFKRNCEIGVCKNVIRDKQKKRLGYEMRIQILPQAYDSNWWPVTLGHILLDKLSMSFHLLFNPLRRSTAFSA